MQSKAAKIRRSAQCGASGDTVGLASMSVAALLAAALLAFQRPYHGIWHDSVLYLGQALAVVDPDIFRQDLFFAYGSQSRFTLVQYLLKPLFMRVAKSMKEA